MKAVILSIIILGISACAVIDPWVYKINIPQGNFIEQRDVDNLRVGMTREQVQFVLGSPVLQDSFRDDTWIYMYRLKPGRGDIVTRELSVQFDNDLLTGISGDFDKHEQFDVPLTE
ncbi:outer membrane protein assembly factor BamE [Aliidiomarina minuta]|uniref:Outer membrane protein assembly factor BamE n=1 Tax=Aliidiomarina minuta TaxID=880057 RepID=A0A432W599_9GAMM|nr:outer membrane protein assembly factor BamE [Aliidiomarina minuta]RUO25243.1 outer membrane protein assembly factor BamE [Aliidiomarina minuta]